MEIDVGNIFDRTQSAWESGRKVIIHKGGTGSGKTYDIIIFLIFYIAIRNPNFVITVVSESKPHLDIGAIRILKQVLSKVGMFRSEEFNISTGRYTFPNGSIIEFFSADRIDKALGARRDVLYGNEINSLKFEVFDELARRSEYVIGDFNPTQQFWLEKFLEYYEGTVITSNYKDNPFLPETERSRIERRASMDANFRRIHIDCEYGSYEGLVFPEFTVIDQAPEGLNYVYGLDFGFTNDPTALIRIGMKDNALYLDEVIYRTGLTNSDIIRLIKENGIRPGYDELIADCAEPKSIEDLTRAGYNVKPSAKGADSVRQGIDVMKQFHIHITQRSINTIKEFRNYSWVMDKTGQPTNKPSDVYNHAIDAIRYGTQALAKPALNDYFL